MWLGREQQRTIEQLKAEKLLQVQRVTSHVAFWAAAGLVDARDRHTGGQGEHAHWALLSAERAGTKLARP